MIKKVTQLYSLSLFITEETKTLIIIEKENYTTIWVMLG